MNSQIKSQFLMLQAKNVYKDSLACQHNILRGKNNKFEAFKKECALMYLKNFLVCYSAITEQMERGNFEHCFNVDDLIFSFKERYKDILIKFQAKIDCSVSQYIKYRCKEALINWFNELGYHVTTYDLYFKVSWNKPKLTFARIALIKILAKRMVKKWRQNRKKTTWKRRLFYDDCEHVSKKRKE